jgi:hypothetical protein
MLSLVWGIIGVRAFIEQIRLQWRHGLRFVAPTAMS